MLQDGVLQSGEISNRYYWFGQEQTFPIFIIYLIDKTNRR